MPQNISMSISTGPMGLALALEQGRQHTLLYLMRNAQPSLHCHILLLFPQVPVYRHTEGHLTRSLERKLAMQAKGQVRKGLFTKRKELKKYRETRADSSERLI